MLLSYIPQCERLTETKHCCLLSFVCGSLQHLSKHCQKVCHNICFVMSVCLLAIFLPLFMQKVRQRTQRENGVTGAWKVCVWVCISVRESRSTHRYIYLCLHMRPWFVWPTCTCQWLSSVLFAQSCSLTRSRLTLQDPATPRVSPAHSPPENGLDKSRVLKKDAAPNSPASVASSGSTPSSKAKDHAHVSGHTERLDRRWNKEVKSGRGWWVSWQTEEHLSSEVGVCVKD